MLLQKPGEHQPTAERHDRQRERQVDEGDAAHANREQDHGERNDHAGHFQAHEPALGRTAKAHVCAGHECGGYNHSRKQPDIHGWAPRAWAILGTLAAFKLMKQHPARLRIDAEDDGIRSRCHVYRGQNPAAQNCRVAFAGFKSADPVVGAGWAQMQKIAEENAGDHPGVAHHIPGDAPALCDILPINSESVCCDDSWTSLR